MTQGSAHGTPFIVGVISDTHGTVSDAALAALEGCDAIVHAGDIGDGWVLETLETIGPVTAVRGNTDFGAVRHRVPEICNVVLGGVRFLVAHDLDRLVGATDPVAAGARVVVTGHTHVLAVEIRDGLVFVNPGSASAPRGESAPTVVIVRIGPDGVPTAEVIELL